ncbi:MAG: dihydrofolate reductase [Candidatus Uhrbacteria bacterium]|nr:dihydrofolate reductase [Candidatus Uhrbacteria bacterium]
MSIILVAAVAKNGCIGKAGQIPWHIPEDLKHFKDLTMGHPVLMGRKTWESIPDRFRPLPGRTNIVLTKQLNFSVPQGVEVFADMDEALQCHSQENLFVIGGAEIYRELMPLADRLLITHVDQVVDGDAFFPKIDPQIWREVEREDHNGFSFVSYFRISHS